MHVGDPIFRSPLRAPAHTVTPVAALVRDAAIEPDRAAIVDGVSGEQASRAFVADRSASLAAGLMRRGIGPGEPVAVAMANAATWPVVALGIWRAGAALAPLSPYWGAEETARLLALVTPRVAIASPEVAPMLRDAISVAGLSTDVLVAATTLEDDPPVAALAASEGGVPAEPSPAAEDLAAITFSSGTSGLTKGVRLTHWNLAASAAQVAASFALDGAYDAGSVTLAGAPFFASMGLGTALCAPLCVGAPIVTVPVPRTEPILAAAGRHRATHAVVPLPVLEAIGGGSSTPAGHPVSLQLLATGGAHVPVDVKLRASERLGCVARDGYGMTEATSMISGPVGGPNDPGTVGWLAAGTEARVVDPETGRDVGNGRSGELWIRGPQVMDGYHGNPEATAATLTADGWLRTGDLGRVRDDGQLVLEDRIKELIKVRGVQVAPAEVELVLREHEAVRDAGVVGSPHPRDGEVPVAYVALSESASSDELADFAAARLARHKRPREVRIVERVPRAPSGKLLRRLLPDPDRRRSG